MSSKHIAIEEMTFLVGFILKVPIEQLQKGAIEMLTIPQSPSA